MTHQSSHIIITSAMTTKERLTMPIVGKVSAAHLLYIGTAVGMLVGAFFF